MLETSNRAASYDVCGRLETGRDGGHKNNQGQLPLVESESPHGVIVLETGVEK